MLIVKIVLVAASIAIALGVAQRERLFERAGFVGGCDVMATPLRESGQWWSCREGILSGYPSLVRENCAVERVTPNRQVWRCPTPIERPSAL